MDSSVARCVASRTIVVKYLLYSRDIPSSGYNMTNNCKTTWKTAPGTYHTLMTRLAVGPLMGLL